MADIRYLQEYLREKDHSAQVKDYFLKLTEEVGELGRAIRMDLPHGVGEDIKGTIDEEIWDVIYYALVIANCYGIDRKHITSRGSIPLSSTIPPNADCAGGSFCVAKNHRTNFWFSACFLAENLLS